MNPICLQCEDRGYLIGFDAAGYEVVSSFCTCPIGTELKNRLWLEKMMQANIFKHYFDFELEKIQEKPGQAQYNYFLNTMRQYAFNIDQNKKNGVNYLIVGRSNTGKTTISSLILKEALKKGYSAFYSIWSDLLGSRFDYSDFMDKIKTVDFLVIDDFGVDDVNTSSKYPLVTFENVLKTRYGNLLPTLILSRLTYQELIVRFEALITYIPTTNVISI